MQISPLYSINAIIKNDMKLVSISFISLLNSYIYIYKASGYITNFVVGLNFGGVPNRV